jgi:hypothetical protein
VKALIGVTAIRRESERIAEEGIEAVVRGHAACARRLGLLHEMVPKAATIAVLVNPNYSEAESQLREVQEAAARLGVQLVVMRANAVSDFDPALVFDVMVAGAEDAPLVLLLRGFAESLCPSRARLRCSCTRT